MKNTYILRGLLLFLVSYHVVFSQSISIDASNAGRRQVIDGFGSCIYGSEAEKSYFQTLFLDDAACSIMRMDMTPTFKAPYSNNAYGSFRTYTGPSDYSAGGTYPIPVMTPNITTNIAFFDFTSANMPRSAGSLAQAGTLKKAQLGDFKIYGSIWSPAPWIKMTSGGSITGQTWSAPDNTPYPFLSYGNFVGGKIDVSNTPLPVFFDGVQNTSALTQFARATAAYIRGFQNTYNVKFYGFSIQNELNFETSYNSATYHYSSEYIAAVVAVRRELDKYADLKDIKIVGPEDLLSGATDALWAYGPTQDKNLKYLQNIGLDTAATRAVDFFCIHGYSADGVASAGANPIGWERWANGWTASPVFYMPSTVNGFIHYNKKSWMIETSGEQTAWLSPSSGYPSDGAFSIALNIHQALTTGQESGYLYWQMADGGTTPSSYSLTGSTSLSTAPKYNAFKHFSKFIRPNSTLLSTSLTGIANILSSAYVNALGNDLTIVLINTNSITSAFTDIQ
jgi:O-glycosyl hydrolase